MFLFPARCISSSAFHTGTSLVRVSHCTKPTCPYGSAVVGASKDRCPHILHLQRDSSLRVKQQLYLHIKVDIAPSRRREGRIQPMRNSCPRVLPPGLESLLSSDAQDGRCPRKWALCFSNISPVWAGALSPLCWLNDNCFHSDSSG